MTLLKSSRKTKGMDVRKDRYLQGGPIYQAKTERDRHMKFEAKKTKEIRKAKAYLVQGTSQQYLAVVNYGVLHTLTLNGGGSLNYETDCNYSIGDEIQPKETVIEVFYEGDTLEITF